MEQYVATLIPVDSEYAPVTGSIAAFFSSLVDGFGFEPVAPRPETTSLMFQKPSGQMRTVRNTFTGEVKTFPGFDVVQLKDAEELTMALSGLNHYDARLWGRWSYQQPPLQMLLTDGRPYTEPLVANVDCCLREEPVSMSSWYGDQSRPEAIWFGQKCEDTGGVRILTNPWTAGRIEAAGAACARFWIQIEFGKFILPAIKESDLNSLRTDLVTKAEDLFQTRLVQSFHML